MGGGFDIFCGLPIYFELIEHGITVHLANYSFSDIESYDGGERLSPTLVGITPDFDDVIIYCPELYLSRWFREKRDREVTIWSFHKTGTKKLLGDYQLLVEHLDIDGILLIDGGVDSLVRGDEAQTATLIEDAISLFVVNELREVPLRMIACVGFGIERDLTYGQILENIAGLMQDGATLGSCALLPQMPAYQLYEEAVLYAQAQRFQDPSVINSSIISAVRGEFGDYHLTEKTSGSRLRISPLMTLYWFFDLDSVAARNLYLRHIAGTETFLDTLESFLAVRSVLPVRKDETTFRN